MTVSTTTATIDDVLAHLRDSLDDLRLSTPERHALDALLVDSAADEEALRRVRNHAFALVQQTLRNGGEVMALMRWLERVVKALDVARTPTGPVETHVWFSPGEACRNGVIRQLRQTQRQACICVFTISDDRIAEAIAEAHRRGVQVRIITDNDKRFDAGSDIDTLRRLGVSVAEDASPAHMHHKFAVYDERVLHNGSFNWTRSASHENEENLVHTTDPSVVGPFLTCFERLWARYGGR